MQEKRKEKHRKNVNKSKSPMLRDMYNASANGPVMRLPFHIVDPPDTGYQIQSQVCVNVFL